MAASATFALKAGVWFRRGRLLIASPDSLGTACPLSGRNSTYRADLRSRLYYVGTEPNTTSHSIQLDYVTLTKFAKVLAAGCLIRRHLPAVKDMEGLSAA